MTLEQRMDRLERERRWLKAGGGLAMAALLAVACIGAAQTEQIPEVVKARSFHVIGKNGAVLVEANGYQWSGGPEVGFVSIFTADGQNVVEITATKMGLGVLTTSNAQGEKLVHLSADKGTQNGSVNIYSKKGMRTVTLGASHIGAGGLTTFNAKGQSLVSVASSEDGELGVVIVEDATGRRKPLVLEPLDE